MAKSDTHHTQGYWSGSGLVWWWWGGILRYWLGFFICAIVCIVYRLVYRDTFGTFLYRVLCIDWCTAILLAPFCIVYCVSTRVPRYFWHLFVSCIDSCIAIFLPYRLVYQLGKKIWISHSLTLMTTSATATTGAQTPS